MTDTDTGQDERFARSLRLHWLLLALLLSLFAALVGGNLFSSRNAVFEQEKARLLTQARVVEANVSQQLEGATRAVDQVLARLGPGLQSPDPGARLDIFLETLENVILGVRSFLVVDELGTVVSSNREELFGVSVAHRDYFKLAAARPEPATVFLSPPFQTVLGVWLMNLIRIMPAPGGGFGGLVAAGLDPEFFNTLIASVNYAPDMWTSIVHGGGQLFLMEPPREGVDGKDLALPGTFFTKHLRSGLAENVFRGRVYATGEDRMLVFRTIRPANLALDVPLVVGVSRDLSAITAPWRAAALNQAALFTVSSLAAVLALAAYHRRRRAFYHQAAKAEAQLRESESRFRLLFENASEPTLLFEDGRFIDCNEAALALLGLREKSDIIGHAPADISPEYQPDGRKSGPAAEEMVAMAGTRGWHLFEWLHLRSDGQPVLVEVIVTAMRFSERRVFHISWRDITRRKETEMLLREARDSLEAKVRERTAELAASVAELRRSRDQAESASRMKTDFLANVSHELRTPLNPIIAFTDLTLETPLTTEQRDNLDEVRQAATQLLGMINDLIELTGLDVAEPEYAPVTPRVLVDIFVHEFEPRARDKGLDFASSLDPALPPLLVTDMRLVRIMLTRLGENAIRFTSNGRVALDVTAGSDKNGRPMAVFAISDTGAGIAPDKIESLRAGLTQGQSPLTKQFGGLGLGMATTRKVLALLGGFMEVDSQPGRGSTFRVAIPVDRPDLYAPREMG